MLLSYPLLSEAAANNPDTSWLATAIILAVLAVIVGFIIRRLVRQKKSGGCAGCPHSKACSGFDEMLKNQQKTAGEDDPPRGGCCH